MPPITLGKGCGGCCLSGCLVPDEDAVFSTQAIWVFLIRERGTGQLRVPGDLKFYTEPVMTGPGEVTLSGRGWLEENQIFAGLTEKRTRGEGAKVEEEGT